ncbi:hypothetical protein ACYJW8_09585 [Frateuria aurantia]
MGVSTMVTVVTLLAGIAVLFHGYQRNQRKLLLTGALLLFVSVAGPQFVEGLQQGFVDGYQHSSAHRL